MGSLRLYVLTLALGCSSPQGASRPAQPANAAIQREPATTPAPTDPIENREDGSAEVAEASGPDPTTRPAAVTDAQLALTEKLMFVIETMSAEIAAADKDCAKAAAAIAGAGKKLEPMKVEIGKLEEANKRDPEVKAWFEANYMNRMMKAMGPLMGIAQHCRSDPDFAKAMKEIELGN